MGLLISESGMSTTTTPPFTTDELNVWLYLRGDFGMGVGMLEIQYQDGEWEAAADFWFTGATQATFSVAPGTQMRFRTIDCINVHMEAHDNVVA